MAADISEQARLYLPKYLSPSRTQELYEGLRQFPHLPDFYLPPSTIDEDLLQGDGWRGFVVGEFNSALTKTVAGIIVSSSCDIDTRNPSHTPRRILFCPLVSLRGYALDLAAAGLEERRISNILGNIRSQEVTDVFYLPESPYGPPESIALLDDVHPHPLNHFKGTERTLMFRLHQTAFYVFLIKLSIHFCRMQEGVRRFAGAVA